MRDVSVVLGAAGFWSAGAVGGSARFKEISGLQSGFGLSVVVAGKDDAWSNFESSGPDDGAFGVEACTPAFTY